MNKIRKIKEISTDALAILINKGFERVETRIIGVEEKLISKIDGVEEKLTSKIDNVDEKLNSVREELLRKLEGTNVRIDDLALNRVKYADFDLLKKDVDILKKKSEREHSHGR